MLTGIALHGSPLAFLGFSTPILHFITPNRLFSPHLHGDVYARGFGPEDLRPWECSYMQLRLVSRMSMLPQSRASLTNAGARSDFYFRRCTLNFNFSLAAREKRMKFEWECMRVGVVARCCVWDRSRRGRSLEPRVDLFARVRACTSTRWDWNLQRRVMLRMVGIRLRLEFNNKLIICQRGAALF